VRWANSTLESPVCSALLMLQLTLLFFLPRTARVKHGGVVLEGIDNTTVFTGSEPLLGRGSISHVCYCSVGVDRRLSGYQLDYSR
jgi:hypothetical protein